MALAQILPLVVLPGLSADQLDYLVPDWMVGLLQIGSLVQMPLGHQAEALGIVISLDGSSEPLRPRKAERSIMLKSLQAIAYQGAPVCTPQQLELWRWMADYYGSSLSEVAQSALPGVVLKDRHFHQEVLERCTPIGAIGWITAATPPQQASQNLALPKRLKALWQELLFWQTEGRLPMPELQALVDLKTTRSTLQRLADLGLLTLAHQPLNCSTIPGAPEGIRLTPAQQNALDTVHLDAPAEHPWLLHGVTGSGKTEVYLRLAQEAWEQGQGVWILVPEIALTGPISQRFYERFGTQAMALWHSQLPDAERLKSWFCLLRGECQLIVGARSAILAPLQKPGLIIIDECHDDSFKQDAPAPRYDARKVAQWLSRHYNPRLLLGSATPTVGQYWEAQQRPHQLVSLPDRALGQPLPDVRPIDMRQERSQGHAEVIARPLREALLTTLEKGEQAIILLNRRGYNTLLNCAQCGHVFQCPDCTVAVTYHQVTHVVRCHYCGWHGEVPTFCPQCASLNVQRMGTGTQRLVEEVTQLLEPLANARAAASEWVPQVFRLDSDVISRRDAALEVLTAFRAAAGSVLIGTQVVAKGLDIPSVTLVGVINADSSFYLPEYKSHERGFQLLTQVAGRAGRGEVPGVVYLQTLQPDHPVIGFARRQDFLGFYAWEIAQRQEHGFPPYSQLIRIVVSDEEEARARQYGGALTNFLKRHVATTLPEALAAQVTFWGPSASLVAKVQGRYRFHLMIKCAGTAQERELVRQAVVAFYQDLKAPKGLRVLLDVDAESLL